LKRIQVNLEDHLLASIDRAVKCLRTSRSAFIREVLSEALEKLAVEDLEERHRRGYGTYPVKPDEFSIWEEEQQWV
jgi:metal-responsive CopG/Arc/MetJ family transcriptional regulator